MNFNSRYKDRLMQLIVIMFIELVTSVFIVKIGVLMLSAICSMSMMITPTIATAKQMAIL